MARWLLEQHNGASVGVYSRDWLAALSEGYTRKTIEAGHCVSILCTSRSKCLCCFAGALYVRILWFSFKRSLEDKEKYDIILSTLLQIHLCMTHIRSRFPHVHIVFIVSSLLPFHVSVFLLIIYVFFILSMSFLLLLSFCWFLF